MTWLLFAAGGIVLQLALWVRQLSTRNAATVDIGWALLVVAGAIVSAARSHGDPERRAIVCTMVAIWGMRLAMHLTRDRALSSATEDGRYRALREHWADGAPQGFLLLYLAQVPIAALFVVPVSSAMNGGEPYLWMWAGIGVWAFAALGEWIADRQLAAFRADPANSGAVCRAGLWRYSRHPNYFFEWVHWWAYVVAGQFHALTWIGPSAMLLFLFRITGIPYTERQALRSRGAAYAEYQRTTSAFIPWPPRRAHDLRKVVT